MLVCNDFSADFAVGNVIRGKLGKHTSTGTRSATESLGAGSKGRELRGTFLIRLRHVQMGHSHPPAMSPTSLPLHVTVLLGDGPHIIPDPVHTIGAVWSQILARWCRVFQSSNINIF